MRTEPGGQQQSSGTNVSGLRRDIPLGCTDLPQQFRPTDFCREDQLGLKTKIFFVQPFLSSEDHEISDKLTNFP